MKVTFWGVRGSLATPGSSTVRFGGNTACVAVETDSRLYVIDAGTGICRLGASLLTRPAKPVHIFFSHLHSDHLNGLTYFSPFYRAEFTISLYEYTDGTVRWSPLSLFDGVHFPVRPGQLVANVAVLNELPFQLLAADGIRLTTIRTNHPGGGYGFRFETSESVFVHIPDNEIFTGEKRGAVDYRELVDFCSGATVLSHDSQLRDADFPEKKGWGHSRLSDLTQLAKEAQVIHLVPFHHAPSRTDDMLEATQKDLQRDLGPAGLTCTMAYEGLSFTL